jgi:hypothetical protein
MSKVAFGRPKMPCTPHSYRISILSSPACWDPSSHFVSFPKLVELLYVFHREPILDVQMCHPKIIF